MANKFVRIGSMNNIHIFDDGDFDGGFETDDTIKAHQAPVANVDVLRLDDVGDLVGNVFAPAGGSTNDEVVRFDGITGALLKSSVTPVLINAAGSITLPNGATIGQAAGPLIAFDDTSNYLEITGCRVGIGIVVPTSLVHMKNDQNAKTVLNVENATDDTAAYAGVRASADASHFFELSYYPTNNVGVPLWSHKGVLVAGSGTAGMVIENRSANPIDFSFSGVSKVTILNTGLVGIGTVTPTSPLQVVGLTTYANDAAALVGGLTSGAFYKNNADPDLVCVVK